MVVRLPLFSFSLVTVGLLVALQGQTEATLYTWDNGAATTDWSTAANWDPDGVPTNNADQATIDGGGVVGIDLGGTDRIGRLTVGAGGTAGTLTVVGGTTLDVNETNGGGGGKERVRVGFGAGSVGNLVIEQGAEVTSRGASVLFQIGDAAGGVGNVTVAGTIAPYKTLSLINGTLTMLPTANTISGIGSAFNSDDPSTIGANGTLAYEIDGTTNGLLDFRTQSAGGSPLTIDAAANLEVTLLGSAGSYSIGQQWTILSWDASLTGQFSQGTSFVNGQGYGFSVDYAGGATNKDVVLTLASVPEPTSLALASLGVLGLIGIRRRRTR
jgi:hypothetical protein